MDENLPISTGSAAPEPLWSPVNVPLHIQMQDAIDQVEQKLRHDVFMKKLDERYYSVEDDQLLAYERYLDTDEQVVEYARSVGRPGIVFYHRQFHGSPKAAMQSISKCLTQRTKIDVQHGVSIDWKALLEAKPQPVVDVRADGVHSE